MQLLFFCLVKRYNFKKRVSKFTPKKFYVIYPGSAALKDLLTQLKRVDYLRMIFKSISNDNYKREV
jgi:hypothetical protein